jgi:hypothetical protein
LKTRKLLIFRSAQNAQYYEIAPDWNVSGTRALAVAPEFSVAESEKLSCGGLGNARSGKLMLGVVAAAGLMRAALQQGSNAGVASSQDNGTLTFRRSNDSL